MNSPNTLTERWWWLAGSLGFALIVGVVRWVLNEPDEPEEETAPPLESLLPGWLYHTLRLFYAVGIPAAALLWRGALTERGLGLQPFHWFAAAPTPTLNWADWMRDLGWTFILATGAYLVIKAARVMTRPHTTAPPRHDGAIALREAVYHQAHWAFYREPFVLLWGIHWGAWWGLLPVFVEAATNPERWADLRAPQRGSNVLMRAGLAILSAVLYIQTQNLWLLILADAVIGWAAGSYPAES